MDSYGQWKDFEGRAADKGVGSVLSFREEHPTPRKRQRKTTPKKTARKKKSEG
jgi:hypothetical protein